MKKKEEMVVDRQTWLRGQRRAAGCRPTARASPPLGPGPDSQPAAAPWLAAGPEPALPGGGSAGRVEDRGKRTRDGRRRQKM